MRYIKLGTTGLDVSPIALGCMTYGEPGRGHPSWSLSEEESRRPDFDRNKAGSPGAAVNAGRPTSR